MTVQHSSLAGSEVHEPKGISATTAGQIYVADGASSGTWKKRTYEVTAKIDNISTADTVYVPLPYAGSVVKVVGVLFGAITTADAIITVKDSDANSMGAMTISQSGSAAGDTYSLTPASNEVVVDTDYLTIETDGGSSTSRAMTFTFVIERDA